MRAASGSVDVCAGHGAGVEGRMRRRGGVRRGNGLRSWCGGLVRVWGQDWVRLVWLCAFGGAVWWPLRCGAFLLDVRVVRGREGGVVETLAGDMVMATVDEVGRGVLVSWKERILRRRMLRRWLFLMMNRVRSPSWSCDCIRGYAAVGCGVVIAEVWVGLGGMDGVGIGTIRSACGRIARMTMSECL